MKKLSIGLLSIILLSFSCERKNNDTSNEEKETKIETVKKEIDLITDSLNGSWNEMMASDDQKFKDIKRLLDEISYTSSYDIVAHDSLVKKIEKIKSKRFDQSLDTNAIDNYDQMTDQYILEVMQLKSRTKGIEQHPLAEELTEDIMKTNSAEKIVQLRSNYNSWAKQYNNYLKKHKKQLEKLGEPYASYKKKLYYFNLYLRRVPKFKNFGSL